MDALNEYIKNYPEQWQQTLDKYPSLKAMGDIDPDAKFVHISNWFAHRRWRLIAFTVA